MLEAYEQITKLKNIIEHFSSYIINSSNEKDINEILWMTIDICLQLTGSDGATIYLKEKINQEEKLVIKATKNLSVNFEFYLGYSLPISPISLCGYAAVYKKPIIINDTLNLPENHEFRQFKFFDKSLHYVTINTITAPIFDFSNDLVGVLQIINKKAKPNIKLDETNATLFTISYTETDVKLILAISSFVGTLLDRAKAYEKFEVSITNTQKMLANMFDSVKKSISVLNDILISGQQKFIESLQTEKKEKILLLKEGIELFKKQYQLSKITETIISIAYLITRNVDTKMIDILHEVISTEIRLYDIPLKINESEYAIFLHNVDIIKARMIAKRIERKVFEKLKLNEMLSTSLKFLWSFYELKPDEEKNIEEVLSYLQKIAKENEGETIQ